MKEGGNVKFGGNQSGKFIGTGTIGNSSISINNVWLVDGLEHNLLTNIQIHFVVHARKGRLLNHLLKLKTLSQLPDP